jgi:hypothetical protein
MGMEMTRPALIHGPRRAYPGKKCDAPMPAARHGSWLSLHRTLGNARLAGVLQARLTISHPDDRYEQEADRVADQVLGMPESSVGVQGTSAPHIQRLCPGCEDELNRQPLEEEERVQAMPLVRRSLLQRQVPDEEELLQPKADPEGIPEVSAASESAIHALTGRGQPLSDSLRAFMEPRFNTDFSAVRLHTDANAHSLARSVNAQAFTVGPNIVFGAGHYAPDTNRGKHLLAHELTHVVQQGILPIEVTIQRDCADPDFCTPYPTAADAAAAEASIRSVYLPVEGAKFGANSRALYESFLDRRPGDSLVPVEFNNPASDIVSSFAESWATADDQDAIIDLIGGRLSRAPGGRPRPYVLTGMSISNFLSQAEMDDRPINYSNPLSIAGHIAGGIGSSDAGNDYRKVWGNVSLENVPLIGSTGYIKATTTLHYEVFDAIDFCPGDCGSPAEQLVTVPMSRLEASGEAYDVPYKVTFVPESRSKRFFYS